MASTNLSFAEQPPKARIVPTAQGLKFSDIVQIDPVVIQTEQDAAAVEAGMAPADSNIYLIAAAAFVSFMLFSKDAKPKRRRQKRRSPRRRRR